MESSQLPDKGYVPLSQLPETYSDTFRWDVHLPEYAPSDKIGLNIHYLGRLARLGGFGHLRINSYTGDVTQTSIHTPSINQDGTVASTISASTTKAESWRTLIDGGKQQDIEEQFYSEWVWKDAQISLNTREIGQRVSKRDPSYRDPHAWAYEINRALGGGIRHAAHENLLSPPSAATLVTYIGGTAVAFGATLLLLPMSSLHSPQDLALDLLKVTALNHLVARPLAGLIRGIPLTQRRWSLLPIYHVDRDIAIQALSRTIPLVKATRR